MAIRNDHLDIPLTSIEERAERAQSFAAFPINLRQVRDAVSNLLSEVGRYGFFDEYTDHSFKHVHGMLQTAEWVIPDSTKDTLSAGDWLFIVLSIYFHDVGLLVGKEEYKHRDKNADFQKFISEPVIPASKYSEFKARMDELPSEESDRIIYQEFVRYSHGTRIKAWIEGVALDDSNLSKSIRNEIQKLFANLDSTARRDLGLVCDSHTRDDISDISKYKISQPYGSSPDETVNLQYVAVILRTVDLLQITNRRAPSVLYQLVSPTDPISQVEWRKQNAVRAVRPRPGIDREGKASANATPDTIEVHARFGESDGFFGLTSYLAYAEQQIQSCHSAIAKSSRFITDSPEYPWKYINSDGVEADGFLTESFGFSIDQQKILDLLTGHTLYNDTTVVLRELTQNALDAVRLQAATDEASRETGAIDIVWDSAQRVLTVTDTGTGMSQETIVNHLLKVGSSRYQDPQFKEKFPTFSSISRFGIGVLSAFMVSDDVEITTCSPDEPKARRIALRSVHGKYLIKLLDKVTDRAEIGVFPHGTSVRLALRPTANFGDVKRIAEMWLMFPRCKVRVKIDDADPVNIGYSSPKEAIESYLAGSVRGRRRYRTEVEVREASEGGVTLAFAVSKNELFKDWGFVEIPRRSTDDDQDRAPIGLCVEGVGVDFNSPGFLGATILSVVNVVGPSAPKTNVARSALEDTSEQREMIDTIYRLYAQHVSNEISRLKSEEGYSLSRAVGEAPYIVSPLLSSVARPARPNRIRDAVAGIPMLLVEDLTERKNISYKELVDGGEFWTVESPLSRSIETFVREAPADITASVLLKSLGNSASAYPPGRTMCSFSSTQYFDEMLRSDFEVSEIFASEELRRINMKWCKKGQEARWFRSTNAYIRISQLDRRFYVTIMEQKDRSRSRGGWEATINVPLHNVAFMGLDSVGGFVSNRERYLKLGEPIADFLAGLWKSEDEEVGMKSLVSYFLALDLTSIYSIPWTTWTFEQVERTMEPSISGIVTPYLNQIDEFTSAIRRSNPRFFDPFAWDRRAVEL